LAALNIADNVTVSITPSTVFPFYTARPFLQPTAHNFGWARGAKAEHHQQRGDPQRRPGGNSRRPDRHGGRSPSTATGGGIIGNAGPVHRHKTEARFTLLGEHEFSTAKVDRGPTWATSPRGYGRPKQAGAIWVQGDTNYDGKGRRDRPWATLASSYGGQVGQPGRRTGGQRDGRHAASRASALVGNPPVPEADDPRAARHRRDRPCSAVGRSQGPETLPADAA